MTRLGRVLLAGATLFGTGLAAAAETKQIKGTLLRAGKPVTSAVQVIRWDSAGDKLETTPLPANRKGEFDVGIDFAGRPVALLVYDATQKFGGLAVVKEEDADRPIRIDLAPLVHLRATLSCPELGAKLESAGVAICTAGESTITIVDCRLKGSELDLRLPPGQYVLFCRAEGAEPLTQNVTLDAARREMNLGRVRLEASEIAKHYGKPPPPIHVTDARGVPKAVKLADYKGKWVLLEFWGFW